MNLAISTTNQIVPIERLTALIEDAANILTNAHSAAEVLDARDKASAAYDGAKLAARLLQARDASNTVVAAAHRAQARALEIEAGAKRRLADEYDAAQERGEVATGKDGPGAGVLNGNAKATTKDIGLTRKDIYDAREVRDAEESDPGIVKRALDEALDAGEEPTRAKVKRAVKAKSKRTRRPRGHANKVEESQHDRDFRMLMGMWEAACQSARDAFLEIVVQ